jgi:hypothetical protein
MREIRDEQRLLPYRTLKMHIVSILRAYHTEIFLKNGFHGAITPQNIVTLNRKIKIKGHFFIKTGVAFYQQLYDTLMRYPEHLAPEVR